MNNNIEQMKWWGWGGEEIEFNMEEKPELWPYVKKVVGIKSDDDVDFTPPVKIEDINLPEQNLNKKFIESLKTIFNADQLTTDKKDRLIHSYGKSFRDLWRIRHGIIDAAPDCIIYPETDEEISAVIKLAVDCDVVIIPFGGGSNIAGCLEAEDKAKRMVVSMDLKRMNKVIELDKQSSTARIQAGAMGPYMEKQLNEQGFTLGHFPDSFEYSSFGGWVATRSAGMQSDIYGKIEDMVLSVKMVTPSGTIITRKVPKSSNGIDVNHICIGSEGILGVITEATVRVHPLPEYRASYGYMFPDFESGVKAIYECVRSGSVPVVTRLNDPGKTALSLAFKEKSTPFNEFLSRQVKRYLKSIKKFDLEKVCLMLNVFEGDKNTFFETKKKVSKIFKKYGAVNLGTTPGKAFEKGKYDFPYLRDYVMDRNIMADVSETSTVWSNLLPLYYVSFSAIEKAIKDSNRVGFVGCHISHTYFTGASLYFTFGCQQNKGEELPQYLKIKKAAEDAFINNGATLSHHHAVGFEHQPWVEADVSPAGIKAVKALKSGLDPKGIMNPGKIIPSSYTLIKWGLKEDHKIEYHNKQ